MITSFTRNTYCRLAADIVAGRLESAKLVGADVIINCKEENLKDKGTVIVTVSWIILLSLFMMINNGSDGGNWW